MSGPCAYDSQIKPNYAKTTRQVMLRALATIFDRFAIGLRWAVALCRHGEGSRQEHDGRPGGDGAQASGDLDAVFPGQTDIREDRLKPGQRGAPWP